MGGRFLQTMITINLNLGHRSYPIHVGKNILAELGGQLEEVSAGGRLLLVSDATVMPLYGEICCQSLEHAGFEVFTAMINPGEGSKSMAVAQSLYDRALEAGLDRFSPIIALGGGVVGDLAGFVASTYLRGVPFIQVPTTLLAQVDSSVGGKVGINHPRGKNLIGSFYQPRQVWADISTLNTLDEREFRAGLAEVIKYGLIRDRDFFYWLEENLISLVNLEEESMLTAITSSIRNKAAVVELDEQEAGYRKILNLGHTFGHALEAAAGYRYYLHGEAVLIGIEMAVSLAERLKLIAGCYAERIRGLLQVIGLKPPFPGLDPERVIEKIAYDKKRKDGTVVFVLPVGCGEAVIYPNPPANMVEEIIISYLSGERDPRC